MKRGIFIILQQVTKDGCRVVGVTEYPPRIAVTMEKPRLPQREQHMPESWSGIKIL
jgi:hypothetical protein